MKVSFALLAVRRWSMHKPKLRRRWLPTRTNVTLRSFKSKCELRKQDMEPYHLVPKDLVVAAASIQWLSVSTSYVG
jgi:hypothetical protein